MIPESQIGKNIKTLRLAQNLTIQALSAKTDFTKGYLSKVENSDKAPPISTLLVIAKDLVEQRLSGPDGALLRRQGRRAQAHGA